MSQLPYLSIVATARNDNHGGNLLRRMQLFVNGLLDQCQRHHLEAELILVEWNPPSDKPRFVEALSWPSESGPCTVRIIEVSPEIHSRFEHSHALPLFQMIGKNVGIRRARGLFVLATNIDILFSDELMNFLSSRPLVEECMYRMDRYDVPADVPVDASIEGQLTYCRENVIRISSRDGTYSSSTGPNPRAYPGRWQYIPEPIRKPLWDFYIKSDGLYDTMQERRFIPITRPSRLHTNACGDFTLLARDHWFALHGYPEMHIYSMHLDSVMCHAAHHLGVREQVLYDPMRIYHIDHAAGSGWTPEGQHKLNERLQAAGIPQISYDQLVTWAVQMRRDRKPIIYNAENWGLVNDSLPETTPLEGQANTAAMSEQRGA